jgi:hypothetical protein
VSVYRLALQGHQSYNVVEIYPLLRQYTSLSSYLLTSERKKKATAATTGSAEVHSASGRIQALHI